LVVMGMIIGRSLTPLNSSRALQAVRRRETARRCNDNSHRKVQNVRTDRSDAPRRVRSIDHASCEGADRSPPRSPVRIRTWLSFLCRSMAPYSMAGLLSCASERVFVAWSASYHRTKEASRFIVSVSHTPETPIKQPDLRGQFHLPNSRTTGTPIRSGLV
jgi:hypothetical protein